MFGFVYLHEKRISLKLVFSGLNGAIFKIVVLKKNLVCQLIENENIQIM